MCVSVSGAAAIGLRPLGRNDALIPPQILRLVEGPIGALEQLLRCFRRRGVEHGRSKAGRDILMIGVVLVSDPETDNERDKAIDDQIHGFPAYIAKKDEISSPPYRPT